MLTEALLVAIGQSVFECVLGQTGLDRKLRDWLQSDPARLAFQVALGRAAADFQQQQPGLAAAFFDDLFFKGPARAVLAESLSRDGPPEAVRLAEAYAAQLGLRGKSAEVLIGEIGPAAGDFLTRLDRELRRQPALRPVFDSRALERAAAAAERTSTSVEALRAELARAVEKLGGVAIGGEARDNLIVTGSHNIVYRTIQRFYPELRDHVFDFSDKLATANWFVGRARVFERLAELERTRASAYVRVVADAGLGKTALAAEVARRLQAPAFFFNASEGLTRAAQAHGHLCADLIGRFDLPHDHLPARATEDARFLRELLVAAASQAGRAVWVVVDALDEAEALGPGRMPLPLPESLPDGVFVLLTHRPDSFARPTRDRTQVASIRLAGDDEQQREDIAAYLRRQATENERVVAVLGQASPPIPVERFVARLEEASTGNFKYLDYVLQDITDRTPSFHPLDLEGLPHGLEAYYELIWSGLEGGRSRSELPGVYERWDTLYRPAIELLGAAGEPVTKAWLAEHLGQPEQRVWELLVEPWRRFLSGGERGGQQTWHIIHQSFADFLAKKVSLPAAHAQIARYYHDEQTRWPAHGGYASRHLSRHLRRAGEIDKLFALMDNRAWYEAQERTDPSHAAYLADVQEAWAIAEQEDVAAIERQELPARLGRQIRCALAGASLRGLSGNIPAELLDRLVETGYWQIEQALAAARQIPSRQDRARALAALAPQLSGDERRQVLERALALAGRLTDEGQRAETLAALAPQLSGSLLEQALALAGRLTDEGQRARALAALLRCEEFETSLRHSIWSEMLRALELAGRKRWMADFATLSEVLVDLDDRRAVAELAEAIHWAGEWWP